MGGGQPISSTGSPFRARRDSLYETDINMQIKKTSENPLLDCTIREYPFQPCVGDKEFYVVNVLTEDNDGMRFVPCHRPDGSTNEAVLDENGKYVQSVIVENLRSQDSFVFFTDEDMTSGSYLDGKTKRYDSFQDVLTEFQNKMKDYLPEDFNWDSHIGDFSYACFA